MSAYLCSLSDFATVAKFAIDHHLGGTNRNGAPRTFARVANLLQEENVRSVNYRYADNPGAQVSLHLATGRELKLSIHPGMSPLQIVKLCDCIKYQSCETPDYDATQAAKLLAVIRERACQLAGVNPTNADDHTMRPDYSAAAWGLPTHPVDRAALPDARIVDPEPIADKPRSILRSASAAQAMRDNVRGLSVDCASDGSSFDLEF